MLRSHLVHHGRFYAAALLGLIVWSATSRAASSLRPVIAGDVFFATYLVSTALLALRATPDDMRRRASYEDEGILVIVLLTLGAIGFCLAAIFALLNDPDPPAAARVVLTLASVPLGWLTLHTIAAFRYAHLYYARTESGKGRFEDARGLAFPKTEEPTTWDFLYHSFVVGMTGQVSDVQVLSASMRQVTLIHGIVSFFFNTVLLALAVNIAASWAHRP